MTRGSEKARSRVSHSRASVSVVSVVRSRHFSGGNKETLPVCGREAPGRVPRRISDFLVLELLGGGHEEIAGFRSVAQRRSYTTRVEARVVARPLRWVQALGRTAGVAVEAAVAATRRAKATWLRES